MTRRAAMAYEEVSQWIPSKGIQLARETTEVMLVAGVRRRRRPQVIRLGGIDICLTDKLKYLGVIVDKALTFREHIGDACRRANGTLATLGGLMKCTGRTEFAVRKLVMNTPHSVLLYATTVFAHVFEHR